MLASSAKTEMPTVNIDIDEDIFLECYHHLLDDDFYDIDFLYGGRDSGKSRHIAMQTVTECLRLPYFKCLLIRKTLNTVRDSQYELIKSVIEEWGLTYLFSFNDTRLEIKNRANGNGFYGRGLDDASKIKSFNNPSHCWIEEGNQISADDLVIVLTSLRSNDTRVKTWFSFNPECEVTYTDFWLYQDWFSHTTALSWSWIKAVDIDGERVEMKVRATHTTYRDNPYCSPQRKALYEGYKNSKNNAYWYQTYTLGLWGYRRTGGGFWKCFEREQHVGNMPYSSNVPVHAVVDNNRNPYIAVSLWQINLETKVIGQVGEVAAEHPNNTASKAGKAMCKWLRQREYSGTVILYGDPSANASSTIDDDGKSFFDKFREAIRNEGFKINDRVGKSAPSVSMSGDFVNEIYESQFAGWSIKIDNSCVKSVEDYSMVKEAPDGTMLKKKETNKDTKVSFERYGHFSDDKRYFITTALENEYKKFMASRNKSNIAQFANAFQ
jgi:phage terminase large subunit